MSETVYENLQEQVLGAVRKSQEVTLETVKKVVETLNAATAHLPANPFEGKLPGLPLADKLPDLPQPGTVVSAAFDFAGRLLTDQRKFAEELVAATTPLRPHASEAESAEAPAAEAPAAEASPAETPAAEAPAAG
jgi:hypothetical protein